MTTTSMMTRGEFLASKSTVFLEILRRGLGPFFPPHLAVENEKYTRLEQAINLIVFLVYNRKTKTGGWFVSSRITYKQYRSQRSYYQREVSSNAGNIQRI